MASYADQFRCIGPACEDTCCAGWSVPVDKPAWEKYQQLPPSPLRVLLDASLEPVAQEAAESSPSAPIFARIRMNAENECPLLTEERLCRIQAELGEELLSHACATYPRIVHRVGGVEEKALSLSCPEAARLVLLTSDLAVPLDQARNHPPDDQVAGALPEGYWAIRAAVLRLVGNRNYPLWQRLFLLGVLCRRLDSIAQGELNRNTLDFLGDFEATVASGGLRTAMAVLPLDLKAQLDVVLRLAGLMLHRSNVRPRFVECINAFTTGIGNGPGATLESLTAHYAAAHDRYFEPFFGRRPHILENYLVNTILRTQFPFGKEAMKGSPPDRSREYAMLTAQFALMKGLLIGAAGFHGDGFTEDHVVHTVQSAAKHFEHHPEFLTLAHALLVERGMDGARGLAILLRNVGPEAVSDEPIPASPAKPAPVRPDERSVLAPGQRDRALLA